MEDVLEVYKRPYDPIRPLVCFDERPKQLIAEVRVPLPRRPGHPAHYDYEYKLNGVANIFMMFEPLAEKRHVVGSILLDYQRTDSNLFVNGESAQLTSFPDSAIFPILKNK